MRANSIFVAIAKCRASVKLLRARVFVCEEDTGFILKHQLANGSCWSRFACRRPPHLPTASCQSVPLRTRRGLGGVQHSGAHDLLKKEKNDLDRRSSRRGSIVPNAILGTFYWEEEEATE